MKKVLWIGLLALSLFMSANGSPLSAAESFVEKMRQYTGHALSSDEIRQVLVGNTLVRETKGKGYAQIPYKQFTYYPTAEKRVTNCTRRSCYIFKGVWSAKPGEGYCHENKKGGTRCYPDVRVFIEGNDVKIKFSKRKTRTWTLLPGKHTYY